MDIFLETLTTLGVASTIGGFIYVGRKLQILDDLKITIDKIKWDLKVVTDFLTRNNENFNSRELRAYSPLRLTMEGDQFIKRTGFDKIFYAHKADFFRCIEEERPRLKYDVEIAAIKCISMLSNKEYMNFLKILFYNDQPRRNIGNTAPTLGVYLRDKYLAEHPEIVE